jgi:hypothetical protein
MTIHATRMRHEMEKEKTEENILSQVPAALGLEV